MQTINNNLDKLGARIDFFLDKYHEIGNENDRLKQHINAMQEEINRLKNEIVEKENENFEISKKLEKFLT
jgi:peptidoglycan hydrolase CwlO-like protein